MSSLYDFRKELVTVHEPCRRDGSARAGKNDYVFKDGTVLSVPAFAGKVLNIAVRDFADYLFISQGLSAGLSHGGDGDIFFEKLPCENLTGRKKSECIISVGEKIKISAYHDRGFAQGLYKLENMMDVRRVPFVKKDTYHFTPLFSPRMVHSAVGLDFYPDGYLARLAHAGIDTILLSVHGVNKSHAGDIDFNDLCMRAENYGLDVYAYSQMKSEVYPDDEGAEAFYDRLYGDIFRNCPYFKGLILVGESILFPSKDPKTDGRLSYLLPDEDIPSGKPCPGWWPCSDYPKLVERIKKSVQKYVPEADIVFWTYNWGYAPEEDRVRLINSLPQDISLLVTFEMFEKYKLGKVSGYCADYTLAFAGPGKYFESEAKAAAARGIRLYSMANTAGKTWDFGCAPYEPMPYQWIKRYEGLKNANKDYNLSGLMESHTYGLYPSFISDLACSVFSMPGENCEKLLEDITAKHFGRENVAVLKRVFRLWSNAIARFTPSNEDQYGAFRVGPAYPFRFVKKFMPPPAAPRAAVEGMVMPDYEFPYLDFSPPPMLRMDAELSALNKMKADIDKGIELLQTLCRNKEQSLERLLNLGKYLSHTIQTGINAKKWHVLKTQLKVERNREKALDLLDRAEGLLKEEYKNAETAIPIVEYDSALGYECSMDYLGDAAHIKWKLKQIEYVLTTEFAEYKARLNF